MEQPVDPETTPAGPLSSDAGPLASVGSYDPILDEGTFPFGTCAALEGTPEQQQHVGTAKLISMLDQVASITIHRDTPVTLGRNKTNTVQFTDNRISGIHCSISWESIGWVLEDMSSNGTFINSLKVGKNRKSLLKNGDHVSLVSKLQLGNFGSYIFWDMSTPTPTEDAIFRKYDLGSELGRGNFSTVQAGIEKRTGQPVAVKVIDKRKFWNNLKNREQIIREVEILKACRHPNIISYRDIYDCDSKLYLVLERADGGDLFQKLLNEGAMPEREAQHMFRQLLDAIIYLHANGVVHRDLKPENILLMKDGTAKLSDFGLARMADAKMELSTLCGTPQYVAPEIIILGTKGTAAALGSGYTNAVDMWSLGVILYIMLSGAPPFDTELNHTMSLYQQIETGTYSFPDELWGSVSNAGKDLVTKLLETNPSKRLTAAQAMQHPWIMSAESASFLSAGLSQSDDLLPQKLKKRKTESLLNDAFEEKMRMSQRQLPADSVANDAKRRKLQQAEQHETGV